jgi:hypothetical protein
MGRKGKNPSHHPSLRNVMLFHMKERLTKENIKKTRRESTD